MVDLEQYAFSLPKELVAQAPKERREDSRLMVLEKDGAIEHDRFSNLLNYMRKGDALVLNDSKVLPAKLKGRKETGGKIELLIFDRMDERTARTLIKGKVREGDKLEFEGFSAVIKDKVGGVATIEFDTDVARVMNQIGEMPLPPYIKEKLDDGYRYQTIFARNEGSIAAPTAGLHFGTSLVSGLIAKGVNLVPITLHINIGTFLPVEKSVSEPEYFRIEDDAANMINRTVDDGRRVFVVGTSTFKCLESACEGGRIVPSEDSSSLFISPPYRFKFEPDVFITNFHLPKSSVLLLTCAFAGRERLLKAYEEAINRSYRFYSFGDSMMIFNHRRNAGV